MGNGLNAKISKSGLFVYPAANRCFELTLCGVGCVWYTIVFSVILSCLTFEGIYLKLLALTHKVIPKSV